MDIQVPPAAVLVEHRVADYEAFTKAFADHEAARIEAGFLGHDVGRDADDPNKLWIYCAAGDVDKMKALVASDGLKEAMKKATVVGEPTITLMTPMSGDFSITEKLPAMIVFHGVESYDRWRPVYDEMQAFREKCGITGQAVNQELGNPNQVIVYHEARKMDALRSFVRSGELEEAMKRAGVKGAPSVHFMESVDRKEY